MKDLFKGYCDIVRDLLPLYADGCTSERASKVLRTHMINCSECRRYLSSIKKCRKNGNTADIPDISPDYSDFLKKVKHRKKIKHSIVWTLIGILAVGNVALALSHVVSNNE